MISLENARVNIMSLWSGQNQFMSTKFTKPIIKSIDPSQYQETCKDIGVLITEEGGTD